jgi:hypothetical protein
MARRANSVALFYSYSHRDEAFREELEKHLSLLKRRGVITDWSDRKIGVGTEWKDSIDAQVELAQVILLMVSADFIASDYCYDVELKRAMERHEKGEVRIVPVILRPCDWADAPFGKLQALPKDARPVTKWSSQDEAWLDVVRGIRSTCDEIVQRQISNLRIYCEKPATPSGLLVWPRCSIAPRPPSNQEHGTGGFPLKWGQSETVFVEPGTEYSIHVETGVPFGGNVALADAVCSVAKNETVQYVYRITERPGKNQFERFVGRLLQVTNL